MSAQSSLERPILTPGQLLVEGRSAEIFFREWVEATDLKNRLQVRDFGSISNLAGYLKLFSGLKDFREKVNTVGIIRDAEEKAAASAFDSVCASLTAAGIKCPKTIGEPSDGTPKAGIFILPDCDGAGMLETLCWQVIQNDAKSAHHSGCVISYIERLREKNKIQNETKAKVWAYLAGFGKFEPQLGKSAQAKIWDWSSPVFSNLSKFLNSL